MAFTLFLATLAVLFGKGIILLQNIRLTEYYFSQNLKNLYLKRPAKLHILQIFATIFKYVLK